MSVEKKIKKQIIAESSKNPEKFYPVKALESFGLKRFKCKKCGVMFWSSKERDVCGDTNCVGKYSFIENSPCPVSMEFTSVYLEFAKILKNFGYQPVKRFPTVARWRDDLDFNIASIIGFQPYVVRGEVQPSANPLVIPQICLRFSDIDNVGFTGRHHTGFTMIGQHTFQKPDKYMQNDYFSTWFNWYLNGMKIPVEELTVHEDAWAGGGNCGPSLEVFCRGLELGNQVYMIYDMSSAQDISELKELNIKVLDMGMGAERCCWMSKGSLNSYQACMPKACDYIMEKTGIVPDYKVYKKFLPYSGMLNLDEVDDIDSAWKNIAKLVSIDFDELIQKIDPIAGIYAIADHTRTLLYALSDGALPSNVKGGYNLRLIYRRAQDFIEKYKWNIDLFDVIKVHAKELKELYPELSDNLDEIKKIMDNEKEKYYNYKQTSLNKIKSIFSKSKENISLDDFIKYYISDGITPESIQEYYIQQGVKIKLPANFYTLVTAYFEDQKNKMKKKDILHDKFYEYVKDVKETELLFYKTKDYEFNDSNIIKMFEIDAEKYVILDKTIFYPNMGGQSNDKGFIDDMCVEEVFKINNVIIHKITQKS